MDFLFCLCNTPRMWWGKGQILLKCSQTWQSHNEHTGFICALQLVSHNNRELAEAYVYLDPDWETGTERMEIEFSVLWRYSAPKLRIWECNSQERFQDFIIGTASLGANNNLQNWKSLSWDFGTEKCIILSSKCCNYCKWQTKWLPFTALSHALKNQNHAVWSIILEIFLK